jgi:acyl-CoA synthetase (NDP forming)
MDRYGKPVVGVSLMKGADDKTVYAVAGSAHQAVLFDTPERAVKALSQMVRYARYRSQIRPAT